MSNQPDTAIGIAQLSRFHVRVVEGRTFPGLVIVGTGQLEELAQVDGAPPGTTAHPGDGPCVRAVKRIRRARTQYSSSR